LGYVLRRAQLWVFRDIIYQMAEFDIKPAQFSVLTVIGANPGITQRNLGRSLEIEPGRLVLMLDELERRGLTKREQSGSDRRSRTLSLTSAGKKQLGRLTALADEHEARLLPDIHQEERQRLLAMLQSIGRGHTQS
jgi:DNA-binding MarR family transcriptional regulator